MSDRRQKAMENKGLLGQYTTIAELFDALAAEAAKRAPAASAAAPAAAPAPAAPAAAAK